MTATGARTEVARVPRWSSSKTVSAFSNDTNSHGSPARISVSSTAYPPLSQDHKQLVSEDPRNIIKFDPEHPQSDERKIFPKADASSRWKSSTPS